MAGFLEGYGVEDARRARTLKWALILILSAIVIGSVLYFLLRSYPAKAKVGDFLEDLRRQNYRAAYEMWGCTASSPCRDYSFEKFLEDWGPKSPHANAAAASIARTRYCGPGVIVTVNFGKSGDDVLLWYQRSDRTLGFAPWPVCAPQPKAWQ